MSTTKVNTVVKAPTMIIVKSKQQLRVEREVHQRRCARLAYKQARKLLPKKQRERQVRQEQFAARSMTVEQVEEQGFGPVLAAFAGAAVSAAVSLRRVARGAVHTTDATASLFSSIQAKLDEFASFARKLCGDFWLIPFGILAHFVVSQFVDIPLVLVLATAYLSKVFSPDLWSIIRQYFLPNEQSGSNVAEYGALLCTLVCTLAVPLKSTTFALGELLKRMGGFQRGKEGFESFFRLAIKYAEKAVNTLLSMFSSKQVQWMDESERLTDVFCQRVDDFEILTKQPASTIPIETLLQAVDMQIDAIGLKTTVRDPSLRLRVDRALSRLSVLLVPFQGAISNARNYRAEPVFILLQGDSGVGKTMLVTKLACTILVKAGLTAPDQALHNLWQKGTTEFWNGYTNQKCLVADDCFQVKPIKGKDDNEYMNVIRMVGSWAYALNFADLESKGKFYFDTPLIIGTTNVSSLANEASQVINQPDAVVRRIRHPYKLVVESGYTTHDGRLDYTKVNAEFQFNLEYLKAHGGSPDDFFEAYPWHAWKLVRHDFSNPMATGVERSVKSLIEEVVDQLKSSYTSHASSVADLEYFLKGIAGGDCDHTAGLELQSGLSPGASCSHSSQTLPEPGESFVPDDFSFEHEDLDFPIFGELQVAPDPNHRDHFQRLRGFVHTRFRGVLDKLVKLGVFSLGLTGGYFVAKHCVGLLVCVIGGFKNAISGIMSSLFGGRGRPRRKKVCAEQSNIKELPTPKPTQFRSPKVTLEAGAMRSHIHDLVYDNTFGLFLDDGDERQVMGQVQFIEGALAMQPAHFTRQIDERHKNGQLTKQAKLVFHHVWTDMQFSLTVPQYLAIERARVADHDVEFLKMPAGSYTSARKITQFFLPEDKYAAALKARPCVRLDVFRYDKHKHRHTMEASSFDYVKSLSTSSVDYEDFVSYAMETEVGMCGAPLTIADNRYYGGACYLGLHTAGSPGLFRRRGFATIVTREMVEQARSQLRTTHDSLVEDLKTRGVDLTPIVADYESGLVGNDSLVKGSFQYLGTVDKPVVLSPNTKFKLSPIGEAEPFGPNPQRPAHLKPFIDSSGVRVSPMLEGLRAYASPHRFHDIPDIEAVVSLATQPFRSLSIDETRSILTFDEAVVGVEGLKLKSVARSTSAGYPYVLTHKCGKRDFFGDGQEFDLSSSACSELRERVAHIVACAQSGNRLAHLFVDFLKDETRPHHKVDAGATRIISAAPLDYVVAFRMYFGAFMAAMFRHHTDSGMCPGINPYNEWWRLASRLSQHGSAVFDGDFKRFDSSEQPVIHHAILRFVNRWYDDGPVNAAIREVLWMELTHSRHITGTGSHQVHVMQWNKSLPSGHPFTTMVNSLYSLVALTLCYVRMTGDYKDMWDHVYIATFGDDNIVNVSDALTDIFNQVTVSAKMEELLGLQYTSGAKDGVLRTHSLLTECTFLKRTFVRDPLGSGGWLAPLDPGSFLYVPYYYKNNRDIKGEILRQLENMLGELSLHSQTMWDDYFPTTRTLMHGLGSVPSFETRGSYQDFMRSRLDAWF